MTDELKPSSSAATEELSTDSANIDKDNKWKRIREQQPQTLNKTSDQVATETASKDATTDVQSVEVVQSMQAKLEEENKSLKQQLQYLEAELQNVARRNREGLEKARRYAGVNTVEAFFPLLDSLEVAHENATEQVTERTDEGKDHILDLMYSIFKKLGVVTINPIVAESFDPNLHSAVAIEAISDSNQAAHTIIKVVRKGYRLHERVIRPAMVVISALEES